MTTRVLHEDERYRVTLFRGSGDGSRLVVGFEHGHSQMRGGLTPAQAVQLINKQKAQVIDVCEPAEFAAAHVTGAKNIPLGQLGQGKGLPSNKAIPLVVVCASGSRSARAVAELHKLGHENAQSLAGGLKAWREAQLPIDKA